MEKPDLELQAMQFILRFLWADPSEREALRSEGAGLAHQLRDKAIDMASSRATEFNPLLFLYHLLAAKVALLTYWPESLHAMAIFEKDIENFSLFDATRPLFEEYERFRAAYTGLG